MYVAAHHHVKLREVQLRHRLVGMVACTRSRDDHVHAAAKLAVDRLGNFCDLLRVCDVGLHGDGLAAQRADQPHCVGQGLCVAADDQQVGARLCEGQRDGLANALAAAGDDDDPAFEFIVL